MRIPTEKMIILIKRLICRLSRPRCLLILLLGGSVYLVGGYFGWLWDLPDTMSNMDWLPLAQSRTKSKDDGSSSSRSQGSDHSSYFGGSQSEADLNFRRPLPLQCGDRPVLRYTPKQRFCEFNTTSAQDCYDSFAAFVEGSTPSWVFLGDALHMQPLAAAVSQRLPYKIVDATSNRHACQNLDYYRLPPPNDGWLPPKHSHGEGPIGYGVEHPYCMDCRTCWNVKLHGPSVTTTTTTKKKSEGNDVSRRYLEYLVVEYSRDVSIPTLVSQTTQETAVYYLEQMKPSVCVASAGLNDPFLDPTLSMEQYVTNVDHYLEGLQRTCEYVIWIGIPAVVEDDAYPHKNCELHEWNNAVFSLVDLRGFDNVFVLDVWETTMTTDHYDPLRVTKDYHTMLARLLISFMKGISNENDHHRVRRLGQNHPSPVGR